MPTSGDEHFSRCASLKIFFGEFMESDIALHNVGVVFVLMMGSVVVWALGKIVIRLLRLHKQ